MRGRLRRRLRTIVDFERIREEAEFSAGRSRGPGGQNLNKVSSAALLTWDYGASAGLSSEEKARVGRNLADRINSEGLVYLRSDEFRDLGPNKARALEKLETMLTRALHVPRPRK